MPTESLLIDGKRATELDLIAFYRDPERAKQLADYGGRLPPVTAIDVSAVPCLAYVNHGRWITSCPQARCPGTGFVWIGGPWQFLCLVCANRGINGRWRPVVLPDDWRDIERVLMERFIYTERGWVTGETVDMLLVENLDLGYSVPADMTARAEAAVESRNATKGKAEAALAEAARIAERPSLTVVPPQPPKRVRGRRRKEGGQS